MRKNPESEPLRQLDIDLNFILAVPATPLVPNCSSHAVPLDPSARWRGDKLYGQQPVLHITKPRLLSVHTITYTLTPAPGHLYGVNSTWEATDMGYKPSLNWHRVWHQGLLLMVGEIFVSHWTATTHLKLGSPQSVRCCPTMVCFLHWVHGD